MPGEGRRRIWMHSGTTAPRDHPQLLTWLSVLDFLYGEIGSRGH